MAIKYSLNAKLYYKVGGQGGGGSWVEITKVRDLTLSLDSETTDTTSRASGRWATKGVTHLVASIEWDMPWDPASPGFAALRTAYLTAAMIGIKSLDEAGGQGLQADFIVTRFQRGEALKEAESVSIAIEPTDSDTPPNYVGI